VNSLDGKKSLSDVKKIIGINYYPKEMTGRQEITTAWGGRKAGSHASLRDCTENSQRLEFAEGCFVRNRIPADEVRVMSSVPVFADAPKPSIHDAAQEMLHKEIDEIVQISLTLSKSLGFLKSRLKTPFPKTCSKCGFVYQAFEDFFYGTEEIARGTVSYPILGNDFYLHRNCKPPCETTLVVVFVDRRDESIPGVRRRQLFETCIERLQSSFSVDETSARDILLTLLANQLTLRSQGESGGFR
jgi:hypothetical protein